VNLSPRMGCRGIVSACAEVAHRVRYFAGAVILSSYNEPLHCHHAVLGIPSVRWELERNRGCKPSRQVAATGRGSLASLECEKPLPCNPLCAATAPLDIVDLSSPVTWFMCWLNLRKMRDQVRVMESEKCSFHSAAKFTSPSASSSALDLCQINAKLFGGCC